MYWILFVMGAMAAAVIALLVGGLATPRAYTVTRTAMLRATSEQIGRALRSIIVDNPQLELRDTEPEALSAGMMSARLTARLIADDQSDAGEWTWTLAPEGDATRVTLTERGDIANPIARFVRAHVSGYHRAIERQLQELEAQVPSMTGPSALPRVS